MTNRFAPPGSSRPAAAYFEHLKSRLPAARTRPNWTSTDGPLPSLFVSHGAPFTLDDPIWLADFFRWAQSFPKPLGIVIVSAHWEEAPAAINATAAGVPLYYDFSGFDPVYKSLPYATPSSAALAQRLVTSLPKTTTVHEFSNRGLDHGAFIPLMAMYPAADIPVVQLSMPSLDPVALLGLGQRLRQLRNEGVLIVGSGFMTHSFAAIRDSNLNGYTQAFDAWASDALGRGDVDALTDFRGRSPDADVAHPTSDHYVPLLLSVGAATDPGSAVSTIDRMVLGNSIRSLQFA